MLLRLWYKIVYEVGISITIYLKDISLTFRKKQLNSLCVIFLNCRFEISDLDIKSPLIKIIPAEIPSHKLDDYEIAIV
jgi:hypothetical protein